MTSMCLLQVVVEKKLMSEKHLTRHDIGREEFVAKVSLNCKQLEINFLNKFDVLKVSEYIHTIRSVVNLVVKGLGMEEKAWEHHFTAAPSLGCFFGLVP